MAPFTGPCEGNVIESRSELTGLGRMVTLLVKRGTLNKKDTILCGENVAKIKKSLNSRPVIMPCGCFALDGWRISRGFGASAALSAFNENVRFKQIMDGLAIKRCLPRS